MGQKRTLLVVEPHCAWLASPAESPPDNASVACLDLSHWISLAHAPIANKGQFFRGSVPVCTQLVSESRDVRPSENSRRCDAQEIGSCATPRCRRLDGELTVFATLLAAWSLWVSKLMAVLNRTQERSSLLHGPPKRKRSKIRRRWPDSESRILWSGRRLWRELFRAHEFAPRICICSDCIEVPLKQLWDEGSFLADVRPASGRRFAPERWKSDPLCRTLRRYPARAGKAVACAHRC